MGRTDRERYADLRLRYGSPPVRTLEQQLVALQGELAAAEARISAVVRRATKRPETWLTRLCSPPMLRRLAEVEFDTLLESPYLAKVCLGTSSPDTLQLRTIAGPKSPGRVASLSLADGELTVEPLDDDGQSRALLAAARMLAAEGNLRDMVALLASATEARPVDGGHPDVAPAAQMAYVRGRVRHLLMGSPIASGSATSLDGECRLHTELMQRALLVERALAEARRGAERSRETYAQEFDLLCDVPGISGIRVGGGVVEVQTCPICIQHEGLDYALGRFRIDISPHAAHIGIRNLDRRFGLYHHPHVYDWGQVCWGSAHAEVSRMLAVADFPGIVQHALELLRSCNRGRGYLEILQMFPATPGDVSRARG